MKLLKDNFLHFGHFQYSRYDGHYEHTRENGEVMLIKVNMSTRYNERDITISLFTKENGFVQIANFFEIEGLIPIHNHDKGNRFVELVEKNLNVIEEWLDIVFH